MSDYLDRLVSRSLAPAADVHPRLPSLFEPRPGPALLNPNAGLEVTEESSSPPLAQTGDRAPTLTSHESTQLPVVRVAPVPPSQKSPAEKSPVSGPPISPREASVAAVPPPPPAHPFVPIEPHPDRVHIRPAAVRAPKPETQDRSEPPSPPSRRSTIEPAAAPTIRPPGPAGPVVAAKREEPAAPFAPAIRPNPRPAEPAPDGPIIRPAAPRDSHASATQVSQRRGNMPRTTPDAPPPAPTIQVTIGRLEVRASGPTAAALPRVKKEPALSLETYLQRRTEGGRR